MAQRLPTAFRALPGLLHHQSLIAESTKGITEGAAWWGSACQRAIASSAAPSTSHPPPGGDREEIDFGKWTRRLVRTRHHLDRAEAALGLGSSQLVGRCTLLPHLSHHPHDTGELRRTYSCPLTLTMCTTHTPEAAGHRAQVHAASYAQRKPRCTPGPCTLPCTQPHSAQPQTAHPRSTGLEAPSVRE